ncbi:MAG TPA: rod shape-determining protein MreC [Rhodanobacteraceae bacterium]|nr:rod shape-determining protein MreC [Rhodanobacteraceae bacterium]
MALPHKESSPIFADAAAGTLRLMGYLALACALMVLDHRNGWLHRARYAASVAIEPIYRAAAWPGEAVQNLRTAFTGHRDLVNENQHLREALLLAQARLNRMNAIAEQNTRLKQLLDTRRMLGMDVQLARLIDVDLGPARNRVMIDAGAKEGVHVGQVVIDAHGVMGQIVEVLPHTSVALLITDANHSIPVVDERSGLRGIAHGSGAPDRLIVSDIPLSADVKVGDRISTSGLGGRFPAGFPVGTIAKVGPDPSGMFAQASATPAAALARSGEVLLLRDQPEQVGPPKEAPLVGPPATLAGSSNATNPPPRERAAPAGGGRPVAAQNDAVTQR